MSRQTFLVAFEIQVEAGQQPLTVEEVLTEVKQFTAAYSTSTANHFVGELKQDVGWNKNIDVLFQLWLEERCKSMWP